MKTMTFMIAAGCVLLTVSEHASSGEKTQTTKPSSVYAKVVLPIGHPYWKRDQQVTTEGNKGIAAPEVESWIAKGVSKHGGTHVRAATRWIRLPENGEKDAVLFSGCGCPASGRIVERSADGKIRLELSGWAPFPPEIKGQVLSADIGSRNIATVDIGNSEGPDAYVGLVVVPFEPKATTAKTVEQNRMSKP